MSHSSVAPAIAYPGGGGGGGGLNQVLKKYSSTGSDAGGSWEAEINIFQFGDFRLMQGQINFDSVPASGVGGFSITLDADDIPSQVDYSPAAISPAPVLYPPFNVVLFSGALTDWQFVLLAASGSDDFSFEFANSAAGGSFSGVFHLAYMAQPSGA